MVHCEFDTAFGAHGRPLAPQRQRQSEGRGPSVRPGGPKEVSQGPEPPPGGALLGTVAAVRSVRGLARGLGSPVRVHARRITDLATRRRGRAAAGGACGAGSRRRQYEAAFETSDEPNADARLSEANERVATRARWLEWVDQQLEPSQIDRASEEDVEMSTSAIPTGSATARELHRADGYRHWSRNRSPGAHRPRDASRRSPPRPMGEQSGR